MSLSPEARPVPGMILYRFEAPLLFFNADNFKARVMALVDGAGPGTRWFVLSTEAVSQLDSTGAMAIDELHGELRARNVQLVIARPKQFMRKYGEHLGLGDKIGRENIFFIKLVINAKY